MTVSGKRANTGIQEISKLVFKRRFIFQKDKKILCEIYHTEGFFLYTGCNLSVSFADSSLKEERIFRCFYLVEINYSERQIYFDVHYNLWYNNSWQKFF